MGAGLQNKGKRRVLSVGQPQGYTGLVGTLAAPCHPPVPWAGGWWQLLLAAPSWLLLQSLHFWCTEGCQFCPAGWLWDAGQCYYFSSARKSWEQSKEDCCSRGAQLVTIRANTTLVSAPYWPIQLPTGIGLSW